MVKRRTTVLGLGALAMGSGAAFTSAAFADSTTADADLRAVVEQNLVVQPPDDFDDDDNIIDDDDFFDDDGSLNDDGAFEDNDPPLAFAEGENDELRIITAVPVGQSATFEGILEIDNDGLEEVEVGIAYDRDPSTGGNQYGVDVDVDGDPERDGDLSPEIARRSHQFRVSDDQNADFRVGAGGGNGRISPSDNSSNDNVGTDETVNQAHDRPANAVQIGPGETVELDLVIDLASDEDEIEDAAEIDPNQFGFQQDTVQLISGFTVGTLTDEE